MAEYVCVCVCVCVHTHTHTHTHIYIINTGGKNINFELQTADRARKEKDNL